MEAAKAAAREIVEARPPGVVIGVVAFSDAGMAVQAPTSDQAAVLAAIGRLDADRGTSLGQGHPRRRSTRSRPRRADTPRRLLQQPLARADRHAAARRAGQPDAPTVDRPVQRRREHRGPRPDRGRPDRRRSRASGSITVGVGTPAGATLDLDGFRVQTRLDEALAPAIADMSAGTYAAVADATSPRASTTSSRGRS